MKIWIDLANSPQVLFFRPLIPEMESRGHSVTITSRRFAQTCELADHFSMQHTPVGGHGGKKLSRIGVALAERAMGLVAFGKGKRFDLAISHNSYAQAVAARILGIPFITTMDYEHQPANHICFRLARGVIVPEFFPESSLKHFGASRAKTSFYRGTKEEIYLGDFKPQPKYLSHLGIPEDKIIAVMRPPGAWGLYHGFENPLFDRALEHVANSPNAYVIFLPRVAFQKDSVAERGYSNVFVPPNALDGPNLLHFADLVISGGGTMNREAAVLGTPTYSLFKGRLAAVDDYLIRTGRMSHIDTPEEIAGIKICKKTAGLPGIGSPELIGQVVQLLLGSQRELRRNTFWG